MTWRSEGGVNALQGPGPSEVCAGAFAAGREVPGVLAHQRALQDPAHPAVATAGCCAACAHLRLRMSARNVQTLIKGAVSTRCGAAVWIFCLLRVCEGKLIGAL